MGVAVTPEDPFGSAFPSLGRRSESPELERQACDGRRLAGKHVSAVSRYFQAELWDCCSFNRQEDRDQARKCQGEAFWFLEFNFGCLFLPRRLGVVLLQWVELLLHPLPALQTAPQPIRVDDVEVLAALCLTNLLGAWVDRTARGEKVKGRRGLCKAINKHTHTHAVGAAE